MGIQRQVPEAADGGYWYVTKAVDNIVSYDDDGDTIDRVEGKTAPVSPPWTAWYAIVDGEDYVVVRTPEQLGNPPDIEDVPVSDVLEAVGIGLPKGRIRGK